MSEENMYRTIYRDLLRKIRSGEFRCGDRLPTEKQLCEVFAVSRITVRHAMEMLVRDGVVTRIKGKGTFVAPGPVGREVPGPNAPARRQIGLVVPNFSDAFGAKMLKSIEHACAQKGYDLVLRISWGDLENECAIIDDLRDCGLAGLIVQPVNGPRYNASLLRLILSESPVVVLDRRMPGVEACFVGTDNEASTRRIVQPLFDLGHENIAFVSPPPLQTSTLEERLHAFRACFYERNRVPDESYFFTNVRATLPGQDREEILREDLQNLAQHLRAHPEITAVFASEYNVAWLVRCAAEAVGLRVPEDLSIVCFDMPTRFAQGDEFTHVQQDEEGLGQKAVDLLLQRIADGPEFHPSILLPAAFIPGRSTATPKATTRTA